MTTHQNLEHLAKTGQAIPEVMNKAQKLEMLARWFEKDPNAMHKFGAFYVPTKGEGKNWGVEDVTLAELDEKPMTGTLLTSMATVLQATGISVGDTIGDMRHELELNQDNVHDLVCWCNGSEIAGAEMARRLRFVASNAA